MDDWFILLCLYMHDGFSYFPNICPFSYFTCMYFIVTKHLPAMVIRWTSTNWNDFEDNSCRGMQLDVES